VEAVAVVDGEGTEREEKRKGREEKGRGRGGMRWKEHKG
jgi:hypothetical protein